MCLSLGISIFERQSMLFLHFSLNALSETFILVLYNDKVHFIKYTFSSSKTQGIYSLHINLVIQ